MFGFLKPKTSILETPVRDVYEAVIARSREPVFYIDHGVADTVDGRFDMIALHVCLILRRLRRAGRSGEDFSQPLFDLMFMDMENNLREMGIGDMGIPKRMRKLIKAFYGRAGAYGDALDLEYPRGRENALTEALSRNLYRENIPKQETLEAMARYVDAVAADLEDQAVENLVAGKVRFAALPDGKGE